MNRLKISISIVLLLLTSLVWSQNKKVKKQHPFWKNVRFGGGIQLSIGNGYTTLGVSPSAIYDVSNKFSLGLGGSYLYSGVKLQDLHYNVYGMSALALFSPFNRFQLSAEFEEMNINRDYQGDKDSYWNPALYMGAAFSAGRRVAIGLRYDVLFNENSIYDTAFNPFIRVYF